MDSGCLGKTLGNESCFVVDNFAGSILFESIGPSATDNISVRWAVNQFGSFVSMKLSHFLTHCNFPFGQVGTGPGFTFVSGLHPQALSHNS